MNKKLIALAVAGALAAPLAAQAEATLYGLAHVSVDMIDGADDSADMVVKSRASRVGVKGAEDLGGGLKAVYQFEWQVDMSNNANGNDNFKSRNQIVGLAGGFGTVALGRHDTPMKMSTGKLDIFGDTAADYNVIIGNDRRGNDVVAYLSPSMGGFHVNAAIITDEGIGTGDDPGAYSVAATYENGPLYVALAHEEIQADISETTRFGAGYAFGDLGLGFVYQTIDNVEDAWLVNAAYSMGNNTLKAAYGVADPDAGGDEREQLALGVDHKFSKATKVYALYTDVERGTVWDNDVAADASGDQSAFSVGIVKKF